MNEIFSKVMNLPPLARTALGLAGFTSVIGIIYFLVPALYTPQGKFVFMILLGVALVIGGAIWGIRRLALKRRTNALGSALASQGPTRGDIAEQEQVYREKFNAKLNELKANGLSVYRLPWFVLVGEPGCGKTASLIQSGLDFPLGRDEVPGFGGTRNYNWWFTNEAVILDTAGRIAFHEEGTTDKTEWEFFLKLLRRNRARCPINGVVIALPADKLLRDSAEDRANKAAILRERLRQIHQQLGVRFPTFILVTKMDLVGGFSEFFEEIRVDLQLRNQMFGWSRPGEFQEPYDPGTFDGSFDQVYTRLRDWSMRYLQRKAGDDELGMIVTFPEAFRELRKPLGDYIGAIFQKSPLLEPPFFRGFYFTSAVQEGAPIFDVFARSRSGHALPERPRREVDSKAFFIHDFYAKKVFPENGLVFRSAKHVSLDRRARRLVAWGSTAVSTVLLAMFTVGLMSLNGLVNRPKADCLAAAATWSEKSEDRESSPYGPEFTKLAANVRLAKALQSHVEAYDSGWAWLSARLLFIGASIETPRSKVRAIHARFVRDSLMRPVVQEAERRLAASAPPHEDEPRRRYIEALAVFARWYGERFGQGHLPALDDKGAEAAERRRQLDALMVYLDVPPGERSDVGAQFETALVGLAREPRSFAREILASSNALDADRATGTLRSAVNQVRDYWIEASRLNAANQNPIIRYWVTFADRVAALRQVYAELLAAQTDFAPDRELRQATPRLLALTRGCEHLGEASPTPEPGTLAAAVYDLDLFLKGGGLPQRNKQVVRLRDLRALLTELWERELSAVEGALEIGATDPAGAPQSAVFKAISEARRTLDGGLAAGFADLRGRLGMSDAGDADPLDELVSQGLLEVREARPPVPFEGDPVIRLSPTALGAEKRLRSYLVELRKLASPGADLERSLDDLRQWPTILDSIAAAAPAGPALAAWAQGLPADAGPALITERSGLATVLFWRPAELFGLVQAVLRSSRSELTRVALDAMAQKAQATIPPGDAAPFSLPGLARLLPRGEASPGFDDALPRELPFDRHRFNEEVVSSPVAEPERPKPPPVAEDDDSRRRRRRDADADADADAAPASGAGPRVREDRSLLRRYHSREFLVGALRTYVEVRARLREHPQKDRAQRALAALAAAADAYVDEYFRDWDRLYRDPRKLLDENLLDLLDRSAKGQLDWSEMHRLVGERQESVSAALAARVEALVRELVLWGDLISDRSPADVDIAKLIDQRLDKLAERGDSLPDRLRPSVFRAAERIERGLPEKELAAWASGAWRTYGARLASLGSDARGSVPRLGAEALREELGKLPAAQSIDPATFAFTAPLLDLADHSRAVLRHEIEKRVAELIRPVRDRFPVVADAFDGSPDLARLRALAESAAEGAELADLLRGAAKFRREYGTLMEQLNAPAEKALIESCEAWGKFLYDDPRRLETELPGAVEVSIAVSRPQGVDSAASVYDTFEISLPLLDPGGVPRPAERIRITRTDMPGGELARTPGEALAKQKLLYRWQYATQMAEKFAPTRAVITDRNPNARADYPANAATAWELPGKPVSLLLLLGGQADNRQPDDVWIIPIRIVVASTRYGFDVPIKFKRPYPGLIVPPSPPGTPPRMSAAEKYLRGP